MLNEKIQSVQRIISIDFIKIKIKIPLFLRNLDQEISYFDSISKKKYNSFETFI